MLMFRSAVNEPVRGQGVFSLLLTFYGRGIGVRHNRSLLSRLSGIALSMRAHGGVCHVFNLVAVQRAWLRFWQDSQSGEWCG